MIGSVLRRSRSAARSVATGTRTPSAPRIASHIHVSSDGVPRSRRPGTSTRGSEDGARSAARTRCAGASTTGDSTSRRAATRTRSCDPLPAIRAWWSDRPGARLVAAATRAEARGTEREARGGTGRAGRAACSPGSNVVLAARVSGGASTCAGPAAVGTDDVSATGAGAAGSGGGATAVGSGVGAGGATGREATGGCDDSTGGLGAGGAAGAGGGLGALRGGSRLRGSTYVSATPARIPRCTYGVSCSGSPVGPGSAIGSPSTTDAPFPTRSVPRWVRDAL
jgi:hypothetical protein